MPRGRPKKSTTSGSTAQGAPQDIDRFSDEQWMVYQLMTTLLEARVKSGSVPTGPALREIVDTARVAISYIREKV